jgi:4a-hydroxytetrahydrobiopterin dehydratase
MRDAPLSPDELHAALSDLPGWTGDATAITKTYTFGSFRAAMSFMVRVAFDAEALDHHPAWTNVYDRVEIRLTTHHSGNRVTAKDVELARRIERVNWTG